MINQYELMLLIMGIAFLGAAVLPPLLRGRPISLPMLYVGAGITLPYLYSNMIRIDVIDHGKWIEHVAEMAVIISLVSAGLKLDRPLGWKHWNSTWRLLAITMPLCILGLALGGMWMLGLPLAAAVMLGATLAPTDPVLASDVQVGPPGEGKEKEVPFALTSEAGLNDGLAFPFVNLAILLLVAGQEDGLSAAGLSQWFGVDVLWKIFAGLCIGAVAGRIIAVIVFRLCNPASITDGFVALALTLVAYGGTELVHGYGFIGVFVAAVVFRRYEHDHEYHVALHDFANQIERLFAAGMLILFGVAISHGLLQPLTIASAALGLMFLIIIRPLAGLTGLVGRALPVGKKATIAFFGIRGIGTFYYLAHGLNEAPMPDTQARILWAAAGFIVLVSIVIHGVTAPLPAKHFS